MPQGLYGPNDVYAVGETSGFLGATSVFVTPELIIVPRGGVPGGTVTVQGVGFGSGESVDVYWGNPRLLLGTAVTNGSGSFTGSDALKVTIPASAAPGSNAVAATGQTTGAIAIGRIVVE